MDYASSTVVNTTYNLKQRNTLCVISLSAFKITLFLASDGENYRISMSER